MALLPRTLAPAALAAALLPLAALAAQSAGAITGTVFDNVSGRPLAGATVLLAGTSYHTTTDSAGSYTLAPLPAGRYLVTFVHPELRTLGITPELVPAAVRGGATVLRSFEIPGPNTILGALCPKALTGEGGSLLLGAVRDAATGDPVPGATVALRWGTRDVTGREAQGGEQTAAATTDADGVYRFCGAPVTIPVAATIEAAGRAPIRVEMRLESDIELVDFRAARPGERGTLVTTARAADGRPAAGASVAIGGAAPVVADSEGVARISAPAGTQMLVARLVGLAPRTQLVAIAPGDETAVALALTPPVQQLAAVTVRGNPGLADFEERERQGRGTFLDADAVRRRRPHTLADLVRGIPGVVLGASPSSPGVPVVRMEQSATRYAQPRPIIQRVDPRGDVGQYAPSASELEKMRDADRVRAASEQGGAGAPGGAGATRRCDPTWFVDGTRAIADAAAIEGSVDVGAVVGVEVYTSATTAPAQYAGAAAQCGVIVVWTTRSLRGIARLAADSTH